jgi:peptidoglycan/LPS O-acetylase OafA/YrhL
MALALRFGLLGSIEWLGLLVMAAGLLFWSTMDVRLHHRSSILLLVQYSNFFLIGTCLYRMHTQAARPVTYVALSAAIAATALGGGERTFYAPGSVYLPIALGFTAVVRLAVSRYGRWLVSPPMVFLGRISYPLYLVHLVLGYQVIRIATEHGWRTLTGVIAAIVACLGVATLVHYLIEVPGQRLPQIIARKPSKPFGFRASTNRPIASLPLPESEPISRNGHRHLCEPRCASRYPLPRSRRKRRGTRD